MLYNWRMGKITSVKPCAKSDRLNIFVDGEFSFAVSYEVAFKCCIRENVVVSDEDIAVIKDEDECKRAFEAGINYAVKKTITKKQLFDYLIRKGFESTAAEKAVKKAAEYGYADDKKYAFAFVATYGEQRGKRRLENELKAAGVSDDIIAEALQTANESALKNAADKYLRTHAKIDKNKFYNYLLYRGFDYDEIKNVVGAMTDED